MKSIEEMRKEGYPLRIKGDGGNNATLVHYQSLCDRNYAGVYRNPGGDCCHTLEENQEML